MAQVLGILQTVGYLALAIVLLMLMITIHEFGHYITAKIMHFKIYEFSIGMGKPIFKKTKKNGEIFSIRMIPIGGYCAFGEDDNKNDSDPNAFNNKAPWQRLIVLFSGAFFNFLSAIVFAVILLALVGYGRVLDLGTIFRNIDYENKIPLATILNNNENIVDETNASFELTNDMYIITINGQEFKGLAEGATSVLAEIEAGNDVNLTVKINESTPNKVIKINSINEKQLKVLGEAEKVISSSEYLHLDLKFNNVNAEPEITLATIMNLGNNIENENATRFILTDQMVIESIEGQSFNLLPTTGVNTILNNTKEGDTLKMVVVLADGVTKQSVTIKGINQRQWRALGNAYYALPQNDHIYHNVGGALLKAVPFSFEIAGLVFNVFGQLITGQVGMNAIGGTVATVSVMGSSIGEAMSVSFDTAFAQICFLIVLISINLAIFNWLPIPSLDGARMVFVLIEWIRGKAINPDLEARIHMIGIICLFGFVIFADVFWIFNSLGMHMLL